MLQALFESWWVFVVRGILAVLFGICAFAWPDLTLQFLLFFFAAYVLMEGLLATFAAFRLRKLAPDDWWLMLLSGLAGVVLGVLTFMHPEATALVLLFYIAIWAVWRGVAQIILAIRLRKVITGEWMYILSGVLGILFGLALVAQPDAGALALVWIIGTFAIASGMLMIGIGFTVKKAGKELADEVNTALSPEA